MDKGINIYMKKLLLTLLLLFAMPVQAQDLVIRGLNEEQSAELALKAAQMKSMPNSVEQLTEYAEIGQKYGIAIVATAKELGIAADELLDTTVGKVAMVLIVWKVAGESLLGIVGGFIWFIAAIPMWLYMFRRLCLIESVVKTPVEGRVFRKKVVNYVHGNEREGHKILMMIILIAICVSGFIMVFSG